MSKHIPSVCELMCVCIHVMQSAFQLVIAFIWIVVCLFNRCHANFHKISFWDFHFVTTGFGLYHIFFILRISGRNNNNNRKKHPMLDFTFLKISTVAVVEFLSNYLQHLRWWSTILIEIWEEEEKRINMEKVIAKGDNSLGEVR